MAVDTASLDRFSVQKADSVLYLKAAHRSIEQNDFVADGQPEFIKLGLFIVPENGRIDAYAEFFAADAFGHSNSVRRDELIFYIARCAELRFNAKFGRIKIIGDIAFDKDVIKSLFSAREQIDLAENSRESEAILILKISAGAPLDNQHAEGVLAADREVRDVKFARAVRDLAEADELSVEPDIEAGIHALEIQK